jgi:hypothetical protein
VQPHYLVGYELPRKQGGKQGWELIWPIATTALCDSYLWRQVALIDACVHEDYRADEPSTALLLVHDMDPMLHPHAVLGGSEMLHSASQYCN